VALKGKKLRERIAYVIAGDPRFRVVLPGKGLLCPWCLKVAFPIVKGQELVEAIASHIERGCTVARGDPDSPMMSAISMQEMAKYLFFNDEYRRNPAYRVFGPDGRWICPYCAQFQDIRSVAQGGKPVPADQLVQAIKRHFGKCFQYEDHPSKPHSVNDLQAKIAMMQRQQKFRDDIANLMRTNATMQFYDRDYRWVCPFCRKSVDYVDMSTPFLRERAVPAQAAKHLTSECTEAKKSPRITVSVEEMKAVVERINAEKAATAELPAQLYSSRPSDTIYLKNLRAEVLTLRAEVKRNEDLARSMQRARSVQERMLPSETPKVPGYEFSTLFHACESVSGDFYDVFTLPDGGVAILIGDVSGHGLEAALVMGMAKKAFNVRAQEGISATAIMSKVNADAFPDLEEGTFITAALSILDPLDHSITFTRAGHNPAILMRAETKEMTLVKPAGMMLGVDRGARFDSALQEQVIELKPGDVFLQYTDGVTEATNAEGDEFGLGRLTEAVERAAGHRAEVITGEIVKSLERFMGPRARDDDVTLLVTRRLP
jgi:serine phosphatase RsbU (regulator of sigma subunit)